MKSRAGLLVSQWHAAKGGQVASCLGFDSEWPMDEYLIVVCGIMLFGGQLDSDRLVSSFVCVVCKLAGMQLYVGECVCVYYI